MRRYILALIVALIPAATSADPEQPSIPICTVYDLSRSCFPGTTVPAANARAYVRDGTDSPAAGAACTGGGKTLNLCKYVGSAWVIESTGTGGVPNDASITPAKMGNGDFGAFQCVAGSNPCIIDSDAVASAQIVAGTIVDSDVNASAAIAGTKLANTPAGGIAATTVQAAIDELDSEKLDTADAIPGWPFYRVFLYSGDPDSVGPIEDATTMCMSATSTTPATCFGTGNGRNTTVFKPATLTGYIHRLVCILDDVQGTPETNDVLTIQLIEDTLAGSTPTTIGSAITFTEGTDLADNTIKTAVIDTALNATTDHGVAVRITFDDANEGGEVSGLYVNCAVTGYLE